MTVQSYAKEFNNRLQDFSEHLFVIPGIEAQMRYLLLYHVNRIQPELASRCCDYSFDETISECLQWNSSVPQKPISSSLNPSICNFCKYKGHREEECRKRKKKKREKHKTNKLDNHSHKNVLSLNNH